MLSIVCSADFAETHDSQIFKMSHRIRSYYSWLGSF